jgi:hypothetical protein
MVRTAPQSPQPFPSLTGQPSAMWLPGPHCLENFYNCAVQHGSPLVTWQCDSCVWVAMFSILHFLLDIRGHSRQQGATLDSSVLLNTDPSCLGFSEGPCLSYMQLCCKKCSLCCGEAEDSNPVSSSLYQAGLCPTQNSSDKRSPLSTAPLLRQPKFFMRGGFVWPPLLTAQNIDGQQPAHTWAGMQTWTHVTEMTRVR